MNENLSPEQFPVYDYDPQMKRAKVTEFGLPRRAFGEHYATVGLPEQREVPVSHLLASQTYVYGDHVRNLASVPREVFERAGEIPDVVQRPDGRYNLNEGTHRAAAALLRGDSHLLVNVYRRKRD